MTQRKLVLSLAALIFISTGVYLFNYERHKEDFLPIKIKKALVSKNKKKAKSWPTYIETLKTLTSDSNPLVESNSLESIKSIEKTLKNKTTPKKAELDQAIKAIEEVISKDPLVYSSYKAKLIMLLTREEVHKEEVPDDTIEELLDIMAGFDISSEEALRKESFLIARTNNKLNELEKDIIQLSLDLEKIESPEESERVEVAILTKLLEMQESENLLEDKLLSQDNFQNEDLVDIPLYRSLAKKDYQEVIDSSQALIERYPNSISGYFFLIKALELNGQNEEASEVIEQSELDTEDLRELELRLRRSQNINPNEYWKHLRF